MHPWGLFLRTEEHNKIQLLIVSKDGTETYMEPMTAAEDLVNSMRIDYSLYRGSVYQLDRHPLFKPKLNISMLEYWDYVSKAQMCVDHLAEIDPATHFFLKNKMDAELKTEDDGSASFLLYSGRRIQESKDNALEIYSTLHHRMEARFDRYYNRREEDSFSAYKLDIFQYTEWCDHAREARQQYVEGKITAEEMISRIDIYKEFADFVSRRYDSEQNASLQKQVEWLDEDNEEPEYEDEYKDEYENGYGYADMDEGEVDDD